MSNNKWKVILRIPFELSNEWEFDSFINALNFYTHNKLKYPERHYTMEKNTNKSNQLKGELNHD